MAEAGFFEIRLSHRHTGIDPHALMTNSVVHCGGVDRVKNAPIKRERSAARAVRMAGVNFRENRSSVFCQKTELRFFNVLPAHLQRPRFPISPSVCHLLFTLLNSQAL